MQCFMQCTTVSRAQDTAQETQKGTSWVWVCPLMQVYNCSDSSVTCIGQKPQRPRIPTPRWNRRTVSKVGKHKAHNKICPVMHSEHVGGLLTVGMRHRYPKQWPRVPVRVWFLQEQMHVLVPSRNVCVHSQLHGCVSVPSQPTTRSILTSILYEVSWEI